MNLNHGIRPKQPQRQWGGERVGDSPSLSTTHSPRDTHSTEGLILSGDIRILHPHLLHTPVAWMGLWGGFLHRNEGGGEDLDPPSDSIIGTRCFLNDPGVGDGVTPQVAKTGCWLNESYWMTPPVGYGPGKLTGGVA